MRSKKDSRHHPQTVARIAMLHFTSSFMLLLPLRPPLAAPQIKPVHLRVARLSDSCCARGGAVIAAMRSVEDEDVAQRMKRADLPSVEELSAASFLGGAAGVLVWRYIIGGSALFGALVGVGITRRIAYQPSKAGAYVREAGWVTHTRYLAVRARCKSANEWALAEAHQLGLPTPRELGGMVMELMRKVHSTPSVHMRLRRDHPWLFLHAHAMSPNPTRRRLPR